MVSPPEQFIHPMWASYFANVQLQSKIVMFYATQMSLDHHRANIVFFNFSSSSALVESKGPNSIGMEMAFTK
jgi:hypothetical protein